MATVFRPPIITRIPPPRTHRWIYSEAEVWQNPLLNTLKGQDKFFTDPGRPPTYDWPNPNPKPLYLENRTWLQSLDLNLLGQDKFFGGFGQPPANMDWPVPKGPRRASDLITWIDPLKLNLLNKDQFFGAPGQPPTNNDWPNPIGKQSAIDLRTWTNNLLESTLGLVPSPFFQTDWPNPFTRPFASDLRTWIDPLKLNLLGQDQFFGAPGQPPVYDLQNPANKSPAIDLRTWTQNLLETTLGITPSPFFQTDWPLPRVAMSPVALKTWTDTLKIQLLNQDTVYGAPGMVPTYDWPNPRTASRAYLSQSDFGAVNMNLFLPPTPPPPPTLRRLITLDNMHSFVQIEEG